MPIYHTLGEIPRKRHTMFRQPDGGLYAEELDGARRIHRARRRCCTTLHPPTTVKSARRIRDMAYEADDDRTLRHRHFLHRAPASRAGARRSTARRSCSTHDVAMLYVEPDEQDQHFYKNAPGRRDRLREQRAPACSSRRSAICPYPRGRLSRHPSRHHRIASGSISADGPAQVPDHREPRARAVAEALSQRVRPADRRRALLASATSAVRASSARTTRWATSGSS